MRIKTLYAGPTWVRSPPFRGVDPLDPYRLFAFFIRKKRTLLFIEAWIMNHVSFMATYSLDYFPLFEQAGGGYLGPH